MSAEEVAPPPSVMWAQRAPAVLLTICLEDCTSPDIQIKSDSLYFSGIGGPDKKLHKVTINLYSEIDPEKSLHSVRDRNIEFILKKKDEGPFWPRLTKEKVKHHWLKVDFNKWKDEDDSEDEGGVGGFAGGEDDLEQMMKQMGGLRGAGDDSKANLDDLNVESEDSDDGDLPDLE